MIVLIGFILIAALTGCASGPTWTETERIETRMHQLEMDLATARSESNVVKMAPANSIPSQNSLESENAISGPTETKRSEAPSALDSFMAVQAEVKRARREGYAQALKDTHCEIYEPVVMSEEQ